MEVLGENALSMSARMRNKNQTLTRKGNLSFPFHKMGMGEGNPTPTFTAMLYWGEGECKGFGGLTGVCRRKGLLHTSEK